MFPSLSNESRQMLPVILVRTLFCPKISEMAKHTANTMEAIPWFKAVENMWFDSLVG